MTATDTASDGQIDLFTGGTPAVTEYGARHSLPDGDTVTVGPFASIESADRAGEYNVSNHGGAYELVQRQTTVWQAVTE